MPTIEQIRAARALLDWSQNDLAEEAGLSQTGIARIENGTNKPNSSTLAKIEAAFDRADVEFIGKSGVNKRISDIWVLRGKEGFKTFIYDVYTTAQKKEDAQICVSNVDERNFDKWQGPYREDYLSKMENLHKEKPFTFRILVKEGDEHHVAKYAAYRSLKEENFGHVPFYVYGTKTAIILFEEDDVVLHIIDNESIADAQRAAFNIAWTYAKR
ncbi:MAG: helix-turn-helix transcriptional regulator [Alphaproteobacteria bacterium]|nr:helix-turn-helix transcriptional regulator [Alphaproteobacteria bacterium]